MSIKQNAETLIQYHKVSSTTKMAPSGLKARLLVMRQPVTESGFAKKERLCDPEFLKTAFRWSSGQPIGYDKNGVVYKVTDIKTDKGLVKKQR